MEDMLPR